MNAYYKQTFLFFFFTHHWMIDKLDLIINIISYFVYYQHVKFNALDSLIVFNLHNVLQYILYCGFFIAGDLNCLVSTFGYIKGI